MTKICFQLLESSNTFCQDAQARFLLAELAVLHPVAGHCLHDIRGPTSERPGAPPTSPNQVLQDCRNVTNVLERF